MHLLMLPCSSNLSPLSGNVLAPVQSFQAALDARKAAKAGGGDGGALPEGLTLEDPMVLTQPGSRDGQTKIIREGGGGVAYSWSAARSARLPDAAPAAVGLELNAVPCEHECIEAGCMDDTLESATMAPFP